MLRPVLGAVLLLITASGALGQTVLKAPRDRSKVTLYAPNTCTCQPCGCAPDGSCEGAVGCAPGGGGGYGRAKPPRERQAGGKRFDGQTVVITGGSSGIGFAAAEAFVRECASVVFCARDKARGLSAQAYLRSVRPQGGCGSAPRPPTFFQADVRDPSAMRAFLEAAGDPDVAVLNAGVGGYGVRRLVDIEERFLAADFDHDPISINIRGLVVSMRAVLRRWEDGCKAASSRDPRACSKAMVVTGSISGLMSSPRTAVYAATKAAANSLCRSVAAEYRPPVQGAFKGDGPLSVRINCIAPGPVNTQLLRNMAKSSGEYGNLYPWQCWDQKDGGGELYVRNGGVKGAPPCPSIKLGEPANVQGFTGVSKGGNTRVGEAAEQAAVILALASDESSFVNGAVVTADGGYTTA